MNNKMLIKSIFFITILLVILVTYVYLFKRDAFKEFMFEETGLPIRSRQLLNRIEVFISYDYKHLKVYNQQDIKGIGLLNKDNIFPLYSELIKLHNQLTTLDDINMPIVVDFIDVNTEFIDSLIKILKRESLVKKLSTIENKDNLYNLHKALKNMNLELESIINTIIEDSYYNYYNENTCMFESIYDDFDDDFDDDAVVDDFDFDVDDFDVDEDSLFFLLLDDYLESLSSISDNLDDFSDNY